MFNEEENKIDKDNKSRMDDFATLITLIVDYYDFITEEVSDEDESERWKESLDNYEEKKNIVINKEIHNLIEEAFRNQLNKFIKK